MLTNNTGDGAMPVDVTFNASFGYQLRWYYREKRLKQRIIMLPLMLDLGRIKAANFTRNRLLLVKKLFQESGDTADEEIQVIQDNLSYFKTMIQSGASFRIWWTKSAADYCGFLWACDQLKNVENQVSQVAVPIVHPRTNRSLLILNDGLGGISCDQIDELDLFRKQVAMPKTIREAYSYGWRDLQDHNQPIRVLINDRLTSQPITFYDQFIYQQLSEKRFVTLTQLLSKIFENTNFGISEKWYLYRIAQLIEKGNLVTKRGKTLMKTQVRLKAH
ncbi:DUF3658 domain-containing protein [Lentilactobacillus farraginis]|uniref:DUF1835 domain-containing protein n=2 Tax=Lentilactobacillus farraginis DSM 18382 = JCM 14108 TaxID=1423743 RepID=A0A0R1VTS2_9LACO|nr:DUF3658 domain-containing protein [Lentilactobacillus farraginis]KRM08831.1 hypothetical protein FD41_GL002817 [Lentilactobacillus farraginis DSM 18382 = JCM 14108]